MGCVCGKATFSVTDSDDCSKQRELMRKTSELQAARAISLKREQIHTLKQKSGNGDIRIVQMDKKVNRSRRGSNDHSVKAKESNEVETIYPRMGRIPKSIPGEEVAAGWPSWLVAVAGEAIKGWIPRRADTFEKFDKIGQGTYSSVYKGRDLLSNKVVALKKVRFDNMDPESVKFMAREILILRRLDHPNIIKLEGLVASKTSSSLYLVFEYMEHDLTGLASVPGTKFTEPQVKCYMKQLLNGLDYCHSNGVLHRDIKGSNLLIDNHGMLKIADFGLASYFDYNNHSIPLTSRVVTLWYRPPELLLGATQYGVAVDLWSTGCILGELYTGKPIMPGRTEVEQLHKIFKLCGSPSEEYWRKSKLHNSTVFKPAMPYKRRVAETFKELPDAAVMLMETLLSVDPSDRGTANSALESEFFNTIPIACDPSSLPKYPPSKEMDAKLRNEEKRRQRVNGNNVQKNEKHDLKRSKECPPAREPDSNAELARSMQGHGQSEQKTQSAYFNTHKEKTHSGFPILSLQGLNEKRNDHHQQNPPQKFSYSGPLASKAAKYTDRTSTISDRNDLLPVGSRALEPEDKLDYSDLNQFPESLGKPMRHHERRHHTRIFPGSHQTENGRPDIKDNVMNQHGRKEKNIHFSGPLVHSNNIENVLKEHERRIQETARRLKQEKMRGGKVRPQEAYISGRS